MANYSGTPDFEHGQRQRLGILVCNLGTPDAPTPRAVRRYLAEFLSDPRVIETPPLLWWPILHGVILNVRPRRSAHAYAKIWEAFGPVLKEGLYEDRERRDQLLALARFSTTAGGGLRSLEAYAADLKPNQTEIYYLVGESAERIRSNPKLEAARARGIEVLLLTDPIDAFWTVMPQEFTTARGTRGGVDLLWQRLAEAGDAATYCRAWLGLLCAEIEGADTALLLLRDDGNCRSRTGFRTLFAIDRAAKS